MSLCPLEEPPCSSPAQLQFSSRTSQGQRLYQEDAFSVVPLLYRGLHFAGVFDGHGGDSVSKHCAQHMASILNQCLQQQCSTLEVPQDSTTPPVDMEQVLLDTFAQCDASIPDAMAAEAGSTAVCALLDPHRIWVANCGDSRAVIAQRGGNAVALTDDHKPERPDELERVMAAGGYVFWNGGYRVMGALSMSRAMGNKYLKKYGVIPTPEIRTQTRSEADDFLILASDGLWAALSNTEAVQLAQACLERANGRGYDRLAALRIASRVLVKAALQQGSTDNITVVLVDLQPPADGAGQQGRGRAGDAAGVEGAACGDVAPEVVPPSSPSIGVDMVVLADVATPASSLASTSSPAPASPPAGKRTLSNPARDAAEQHLGGSSPAKRNRRDEGALQLLRPRRASGSSLALLHRHVSSGGDGAGGQVQEAVQVVRVASLPACLCPGMVTSAITSCLGQQQQQVELPVLDQSAERLLVSVEM